MMTILIYACCHYLLLFSGGGFFIAAYCFASKNFILRLSEGPGLKR